MQLGTICVYRAHFTNNVGTKAPNFETFAFHLAVHIGQCVYFTDKDLRVNHCILTRVEFGMHLFQSGSFTSHVARKM